MNNFPYFTDIEELCARLRGKKFFLSTRDWALVEGWKKRSIPLHIVTKSINETFEGRDYEDRSISTLSFCTRAVEANHDQWLTGQVGAAATPELLENTSTACVCGKEICWDLHRD